MLDKPTKIKIKGSPDVLHFHFTEYRSLLILQIIHRLNLQAYSF